MLAAALLLLAVLVPLALALASDAPAVALVLLAPLAAPVTEAQRKVEALVFFGPCALGSTYQNASFPQIASEGVSQSSVSWSSSRGVPSEASASGAP